MLLGGHWAHRGGGLFVESTPEFDDAAAERAEIGPDGRRSLDIARLGQILAGALHGPPVKALTVWGMNPAVVEPDLHAVWAGLAREDLFTVVIDHFMTDTARFADIVLPSTTQLEHFDVQGAWGHHYISLNRPAIPALGEARSHGAIMRALAAQLGLTHPALRETDAEIAAAALPDGVTLTDLERTGWLKASPPHPDPLATGARLAISIGLGADGTCDGALLPPIEGGKLRLLTPKAHHLLNSSFANMARHRAAQRGPVLQVNPEDAAQRGLGDADRVRIKGVSGSLEARIEVTARVRPGVVVMEGKWWRGLDGAEAVVNRLAPARWTPSGQPAYNDIFVDLTLVAV